MRGRVESLLNSLIEDAPGAKDIWEDRTLEDRLSQAERVLKAHRNQRAITLLKPTDSRD